MDKLIRLRACNGINVYWLDKRRSLSVDERFAWDNTPRLETFTMVDMGNNKVALKATNNKYVKADDGGNLELKAIGDLPNSCETFFQTDLDNEKISLQAYNGNYVSAQNGRLSASSIERQTSETFTCHDLGNNKVALIAHNGKYVSVNKQSLSLVTVTDEIGVNETFTRHEMGDDNVALQACNGKYVSTIGQGKFLFVNSTEIDVTETFTRVDKDDGKVAFQAYNGKYVCADLSIWSRIFSTNTYLYLVANREWCSYWETFELIELSRISLRANNGKYVCAAFGVGGDILKANRNQWNDTMTFILIPLGIRNGNMNIALQQEHNRLYVCADGAGSKPLVANRNVISLWETFILEELDSKRVAFKAAVNGKYVCVETESSAEGELFARSDSIGGCETFIKEDV